MPPRSEASARALPGKLGDFLFAFICVFVGLLLFARVLASPYVELHLALGRLLLPSEPLGSGVKLALAAGAAESGWDATLTITPALGSPALVPIDLRALLLLPTAAFIALVIATPFGQWRRNAQLLLWGLPLLELLLLGLTATPLLSFLGGTGPVQAFQLSRATHTVLQLVYRALVAPPGMAFALPLLLWLLLLQRAGGVDWSSENRKPGFDFRWLRGLAARKRP